MKRIIGVAAIAVLAACSPAEEAAETEEVVEVAEIMAADGKPSYGTFRVTGPDGAVLNEVVNEDGTFASTDEAGEVTTGTWVQKEGEYCTTVDEEGAPERCFSETVNDEGVWLSTDPDDGAVSTVERIEE